MLVCFASARCSFGSWATFKTLIEAVRLCRPHYITPSRKPGSSVEFFHRNPHLAMIESKYGDGVQLHSGPSGYLNGKV